MTDLAVSDVTVAILEKRRAIKQKRNRVTLSFGDAALTYPTGGIPMPVFGKYGFVRRVDWLGFIEAAAGDGLLYKYDISAHKLRIYFPTDETGTPADRAGAELAGGSSAPAATVLTCEAVGW